MSSSNSGLDARLDSLYNHIDNVSSLQTFIRALGGTLYVDFFDTDMLYSMYIVIEAELNNMRYRKIIDPYKLGRTTNPKLMLRFEMQSIADQIIKVYLGEI